MVLFFSILLLMQIVFGEKNTPSLLSGKIDINSASLEELQTLPISKQQADDIYDYRYFISYFKSIYQLREINSIDQKTLNLLKPLIIVSPFDDRDETAQRRDEIFYLIQRLGTNEGFQEGMSDLWEDYLITPQNVNRMKFSDLISMPNVSAIDAYAIRNRHAHQDTITSYRDMRRSPGISYYGASNLRHYVYYQDQPTRNKLHFDYQLKYSNTGFSEEAEDMYKESYINTLQGNNVNAPREKTQSFWGFFKMEDYHPSVMNKIRIRYNNEWKAGLMYHSQYGEQSLFEANSKTLWEDAKFYAGYEKDIYKEHFIKVYVGNYRATFGEGLVMENTDFSGARKTGHGFTNRITGIIGDVSRTQQHALRGVAMEWKHHKFQSAFFYSDDDKDAVIWDSNENGILDDEDYVFRPIRMTRRFTNEELESAEAYFDSLSDSMFRTRMAPRKNILNEKLIGGHLEFSPIIGSHIGVTAYESRYDKKIVIPENAASMQELLINNPGNYSKFKMINSEILASYSTFSEKYDYDRNYRRVIGFDWRTVINNTSFQGEYAELIVTGDELKLGDDPSALILSSFTQFDNAHFLTIYRDYDLAFDNPYSTPFYENRRFDGTIFDNYAYVLNNPLLADIYINSERAQAEKGIYFETRYQFHRMLTISHAYLDIWERKADGRKSVRFQGELDYRPIFKLSMRLRYKHQQNRYHDDADRSVSKTNEVTGKVIANLSNFNRISFEYRYNTVWMPPYPYLSNDMYPEGNDTMATGTNLIHGDYICVDYTHNFNSNLRMVGSFIYWDGHGISHWDWEDMEIDFMGEQGNKYWVTMQSKISSNLYLSLKYKIKHYKTREAEWRTWWNTNPGDESSYTGEEIYFPVVEKKETAIRLQLDWKF